MAEINDSKSESELEIIEVPPELRGLSDEEIIKRSEKETHEISGKRKKGERRPSKRERMARKEEKSRQEAMAIFGNKPSMSLEKSEMFANAFTPKSPSYLKVDPIPMPTMAIEPSVQPKAEPAIHSIITAAPTPTSGRVLKASFGAKKGEKPKAIIMSAAELAQQKAEERAKKIREALFAKRTPSAQALPVATNPDGTPVKRPRGRPRKNPIIAETAPTK